MSKDNISYLIFVTFQKGWLSYKLNLILITEHGKLDNLINYSEI